jgi:hypothetical protein
MTFNGGNLGLGRRLGSWILLGLNVVGVHRRLSVNLVLQRHSFRDLTIRNRRFTSALPLAPPTGGLGTNGSKAATGVAKPRGTVVETRCGNRFRGAQLLVVMVRNRSMGLGAGSLAELVNVVHGRHGKIAGREPCGRTRRQDTRRAEGRGRVVWVSG